MFIIELAGPPGAGKSTITKALTEYDQSIQSSDFPSIRETKNFPIYVWNAILLLPIFINFLLTKAGRSISLRHIAVMVILNGWKKQLTRNPDEDKILILDQGPVYELAELLRFGPENFRHLVSNWWDHICTDWASALDMIICLDTSDSLLIERVHARDKKHGIKENSDQWAVQVLAEHRQAQLEVLNSLTNKGQGPKVLQVDTSQKPLNQTIEDIFAHFVNKD